jgi:hypothetical protein
MFVLSQQNIQRVEKFVASEEFRLLVASGFVYYVAAFTNHQPFIKWGLVLGLFFYWKQAVLAVQTATDLEESFPSPTRSSVAQSKPLVGSTVLNLTDTTTDRQPSALVWIQLDKPLYRFARSLQGIKEFDCSVYDALLVNMNRFSRLYYKQIADRQPNCYNNFIKQRFKIAELEDLVDVIMESLFSLEFVMSSLAFHKRFNIPQSAQTIKNLLNKRIRLLKAKRAMNLET